MAHWLNNKIKLLFLFILMGGYVSAQDGVEPPVYKDYKDPDQFEKFRKRRITVAAWQINMLKDEGAIVVKLKTNNILIDQLIKQGNHQLAIEKQLEQFAINRNTMFAYLENFTFCKIYFMYSTSSDSLLNGARQGIFLDTNLTVDPTIVMKEKFYIIAERDIAYSSSIGFVIEDSARYVKESGNPIRLMAIVLKNKYGHQLKAPFPYAIKEANFTAANYIFPIQYTPSPSGATSIAYTINRTFLQDLKTKPEQKVIKRNESGRITTSVKLKKELTYEKLSNAVTQLNEDLKHLYQAYPKPDVTRIKSEVKLFLY